MTRSGIKEESIEIQSKDTMNCLSVKQEEDDGLLTVPPKQFGKLKFPPPCSVVFTGFTESTPFIVYSAVSTAHFDIDTCSFVYKLESGHTVQEKELFFGKGVQVWAFVAGEHVPAVVLNIFHQRGEEASYSLLQVENKTLYHFVPAQAVRYRADGSTKPVVKNEVKFCLPSENEMKPTMLSTPALKTHPENPPMPSISTNLPPEEITMDYPPVKRSLDYEAECSKRQKTQYAEDDWLVLHIPADLPDVDPEVLKLAEERLQCQVCARGSRIFICGSRDVVFEVIEAIEMYLLDQVVMWDKKKLFMRDIALANPNFYRTDGEMVYQREPCSRVPCPSLYPWKWMQIVENSMSDAGISVLIGEGGCGIRGLRGSTQCTIQVIRTNEHNNLIVYISGDSRSNVEICTKRTLDRIEWVKTVSAGCDASNIYSSSG